MTKVAASKKRVMSFSANKECMMDRKTSQSNMPDQLFQTERHENDLTYIT